MDSGALLGRYRRQGISGTHHIVGSATRIWPAGGIPVADVVSGVASRPSGHIACRLPGTVTSSAHHGVVYPVHSCSREAKILGRTPGEVEIPPPRVRTPVVDGDLHGAASVAGHQPRPERQR